MKSEYSYYNHLKELSKSELINLIYQNIKPMRPLPCKTWRNIALRLSYDGSNYSGVQYHKFIRTIEGELRTSLEMSGIGENPVFCGRTDGGVSAISMIVSLKVKSRIENPNKTYEIKKSDYEEYPYAEIINERLPMDIRISGWAPVPDEFNARHSSIQRYYKYYFTLKNMKMELMEEACNKIREMNNFYSLSTHSNPRAVYEKKIDELYIEKVDECDCKKREIQDINKEKNIIKSEYNFNNKNIVRRSPTTPCKIEVRSMNYNELYCLNIKSGSFLHNMVRKIVWLIQSCGNGNKFNLEQIRIAPAYPLIFVSAKYKNKLNFIENKHTQPAFESSYEYLRIKSIIAKERLNDC